MPTLHGDEVSPASLDGRVAPGVRTGTRGCGGGGGAPSRGARGGRARPRCGPPRPARRRAPSGCGRRLPWSLWSPRRSRAAPSPPARCCTTIPRSSRSQPSPASRSRPTRASRAPARSTPRPAPRWSRSAPTPARAPASSSTQRHAGHQRARRRQRRRASWSTSAPTGAASTATCQGTDPSSDLAVVTIDPRQRAAATPSRCSFADSRRSRVGDTAIAIGNPFGLDRTATEGIVSGIGRDIKAPNGFSIDEVIQTDAPINPGNSGGPLLDETGARDRRQLPDRDAAAARRATSASASPCRRTPCAQVVPRSWRRASRIARAVPRRLDDRSADPNGRAAPRSQRSSPAAPPQAGIKRRRRHHRASTARPCSEPARRLGAIVAAKQPGDQRRPRASSAPASDADVDVDPRATRPAQHRRELRRPPGPARAARAPAAGGASTSRTQRGAPRAPRRSPRPRCAPSVAPRRPRWRRHAAGARDARSRWRSLILAAARPQRTRRRPDRARLDHARHRRQRLDAGHRRRAQPPGRRAARRAKRFLDKVPEHGQRRRHGVQPDAALLQSPTTRPRRGRRRDRPARAQRRHRHRRGHRRPR